MPRFSKIGSSIVTVLVFIASIPTVLCIGIVEALMRIHALINRRARKAYEHVLLIPDPVLGYRNLSSFDSRMVAAEARTLDYHGRIKVTTDRFGFRNVPSNPVDADGQAIVVVGDSSTFGWNLSDETSIPSRMAYILNQTGNTTWRVINAGVNGFCTLQMFRLSLDILQETRPNYLLVCSDWNTFFNTLRYRSLWRPGCMAGLAHSDLPDRYAQSPFETFRLCGHVAQVFGNARLRHQHGLGWLPSRSDRWKESRLYLQSQAWRREMCSNLHALASAARNCGAVPLFTTVAGLCHPLASADERKVISTYTSKHVVSVRRGSEELSAEAFDFWADSMREINSVVRDACELYAVDLIDVEAAMAQLRGEARANAFCDLFHYSPYGADFVSHIVAKAISDQESCATRPVGLATRQS